MKIVLSTESFYPSISGVSVATFLLAKTLAEKGHRVWLFAPSTGWHSREESHPELKNLTVVRFRSIPNPFRKGFRIAFIPAKAVKRAISDIKPDIVHLQDPAPVSAATLAAARDLNIPAVVTNHFTLEYVLAYLWFLGPFKPLARKKLIGHLREFYNRCEAVIAPSRIVAAKLSEWGVTKEIFTISNGVDIERFYSYTLPQAIRENWHLPAKPIVLYVGRLDKDKSLEVLFDAIPQILARRNAHFLIVGGGNDFAKLKERAKRLGVEHNITFTGPVPHESEDLPKLYQIADIFVIPSTIESQSIVTMEAMASGLPVIAANAGALGELIKDGRNGYLFEPANSEDLAVKIIELLKNSELAKKMGEQNIKDAVAHRIELVHDEIERLYEKILNK